MSAPKLVKRHPAGVAAYQGDVRAMLGEIKGPTTYGGHLLAAAAVYDADQDRTQVAFSYCREDDLARAQHTTDGLHRVPGVIATDEAPR